MKSDFEILGIGPTVDPVVVKAAYRRRAKEIHPDITRADFRHHVDFIELQQAYQRLLKALPAAGNAAAGHPVRTGDGGRGGTYGSSGTGRQPVSSAAPGSGQPPADVSRPSSPAPRPAGQTLGRVADQAWAFYRAGVREYQKVHPSVWDEGGYIIMLARSPHDLEALKQTSDKVRRLIRAFPRAYYYLSIVKNEYPESLYAADAAEKLAMIERQTERYRHIIESFITHAVPAPRVKRL